MADDQAANDREALIRALTDKWGNQDLVYITDRASNRVMIFSPQTRTVVNTIPTGSAPAGLAITPNGQRLYVANSGEYSVSVIDLNSQEELYQITTPNLGPESGYTPYEIAVLDNSYALISSAPPGSASGGPIHQLNLLTHSVLPRTDIGSGRHSLLQTSYDFSAVGVLLEPGSSPTKVGLYDHQTGFVTTTNGYGIERAIGINTDGDILVTTQNDRNRRIPNLTVLNQELAILNRIQLLGSQALSAAFHPITKHLVYSSDSWDWTTHKLTEADVDGLRQTRNLHVNLPTNYYLGSSRLVVAADGVWAYDIVSRTYNAPPSKLLAVRIHPGDTTAPISVMNELSPDQPYTWWLVSWSGYDNDSGIRHFDLQYRKGDGPWQNWLLAKNQLLSNRSKGAHEDMTYILRQFNFYRHLHESDRTATAFGWVRH